MLISFFRNFLNHCDIVTYTCYDIFISCGKPVMEEFCEIEKRSSVREKTEEHLCVNGAAFVCQSCTVLQKRMGIMCCAVPSSCDRCCTR